MSSFQAWPDIGLIGLKEMANRAGDTVLSASLPSIADADTGFGGPVHCARTVYEFEKRGLSGLHLEDQSFPKRCGHLDNKKLISTEEMVLKIQSAIKARKDNNFLIIARTDARSVEGLQGAIDRGKAYSQAGADIIFPEALQSIEEFKSFRSEISLPLMANMTEFGKTEIVSHKEFNNMGYNVMIYLSVFGDWPLRLWRRAWIFCMRIGKKICSVKCRRAVSFMICSSMRITAGLRGRLEIFDC